MLTDTDIARMAESFAELVDTREQAIDLARRVATEINAQAEVLNRRIDWLQDLLAGHEATALLKKF